MSATLDAMFRYLDALDDRPSLDTLFTELARFDLTCDDVQPFIRFGERSYQRNLVRAGKWYHAWVLCWRNGQRSPIHDHRGSNCVVRVLRGILTETVCEFAPNGHVKACFSRDFDAGSLLASSDSDLHQVSNLQPGSADLVTMHVYSPPLLTMGTYTLFDRTRGQEVWQLEFSEAAGI
jgi:cysteine dioxygenase